METCRLCMSKGDEIRIVSIFNNEFGTNLPQNIQECLTIKVNEGDNLSTSICVNCVRQIKQWEKFRDSCRKTQEILLETYHETSRERKFDISNDITSENAEWRLDDSTDNIQNDNICLDKLVRNSKKSQFDDEDEDIEEQFKKEKEDFEELLDDEDFFDNEYKLDADNTYTCEICQTDFKDLIEYLDHQESHDGKQVFKCSRCSQVFSSRKELVHHDQNHKNPCPHCGKLILDRSLKLHLIIHTDKYKCQDCTRRFNCRAALTQHIITVHTDIKDHICETCGKRFSSQTAMRVHMKSHSDDRKYPCKECSYAGRTASALYIHMSTHANDLCVCEICSKTYKSTRNLNDHIRRAHCKDKKHECNYCAKRFVDKYMLRVHMRCHTGVRPYKCTKCDKSFIRADGLKEHMNIHGQRVLYDCLECGKRFTSKRGVTRHTCAGIM